MWAVVTLPSRAANTLRGGSSRDTLCYASLLPGAPLWLRLLAACVEYHHPGHLAWTTDR